MNRLRFYLEHPISCNKRLNAIVMQPFQFDIFEIFLHTSIINILEKLKSNSINTIIVPKLSIAILKLLYFVIMFKNESSTKYDIKLILKSKVPLELHNRNGIRTHCRSYVDGSFCRRRPTWWSVLLSFGAKSFGGGRSPLKIHPTTISHRKIFAWGKFKKGTRNLLSDFRGVTPLSTREKYIFSFLVYVSVSGVIVGAFRMLDTVCL